MKKIIALLFLFFTVAFLYAGDDKVKFDKPDELFYVVSKEEMSFFIQSWNILKKWESGENEISDAQIANIYEKEIGKNTFSAMLFENFFRNTKNKEIQRKVKKYIQKNKLTDKPYETALLKKFDSKEENIELKGNTITRYSYKDSEYDENINLFDFSEIHPFKDEFGVLLFKNDWNVLSYKDGEKAPDGSKKLFLISNGKTNCISIHFTEIENVQVNKKEDIKKAAGMENFSERYKDNWKFFELEKTDILENCGVDNYFIGYGVGPNAFIPEILEGDFVSCLYSKDKNKIYIMCTNMNFSTININYEIRNRLYNYLLFFTLFCYCD